MSSDLASDTAAGCARACNWSRSRIAPHSMAEPRADGVEAGAIFVGGLSRPFGDVERNRKGGPSQLVRELRVSTRHVLQDLKDECGEAQRALVHIEFLMVQHALLSARVDRGCIDSCTGTRTRTATRTRTRTRTRTQLTPARCRHRQGVPAPGSSWPSSRSASRWREIASSCGRRPRRDSADGRALDRVGADCICAWGGCK